MDTCLILDEIPEKSCIIYGWYGKKQSEEKPLEDIDLIAFLVHVDDEVCMVAAAKGKLTDEMNIKIGLAAIERGYKYLRFYKTLDGSASHRSREVYKDSQFSYREVNLLKELKKLELEQIAVDCNSTQVKK